MFCNKQIHYQYHCNKNHSTYNLILETISTASTLIQMVYLFLYDLKTIYIIQCKILYYR